MELMRFIGSAVCHQMAERSFIINGQVLPLCARCTGIYIGIFFAMVFFFGRGRLKGNQPFVLSGILFAALSFLPVSLDGFFSYVGLWESNNFLRIVTGAIGGASLPGLMILGANIDPMGENNRPVFKNTKEQIILTGVSLLWGLLLWTGQELYTISAFFTSAGVICFWGCIFYLILKGVLGKRKFPLWGISFLLSCLVIFMIGQVVK